MSTLKAFWGGHPEYQDAEGPTLAWYRDVLRSDWSKPSDVKAYFGSASILQDGRVVFNIKGNDYRLIAGVNYQASVPVIRFCQRAFRPGSSACIARAARQARAQWSGCETGAFHMAMMPSPT